MIYFVEVRVYHLKYQNLLEENSWHWSWQKKLGKKVEIRKREILMLNENS